MKQKKRISRAAVFWLSVVSVSLILSLSVILFSRDAFAFGKKGEEATVTVEAGDSVYAVARKLRKTGAVSFPAAFTLYSRLRGGLSLSEGEYTVSGDMSYDEIRYTLAPRAAKARKQIKLTIREGLTTDAIVALFVENGIGTPEGFADAIENYPFSYDFVNDIPVSEGRTHRLDGYLFPDTYYFYTDSTEVEALSKLLAAFDRRFTPQMRADAGARGFSVDEVVRVASLVEAEAYHAADMGRIASVFYNRLGSSYRFLESDATVKYFWELNGETGAFSDALKADHPYNTYQKEGLPPGAIGNPGAAALYAAVYPEKTDYFYFVSTADKTMVYSRTYREHLDAVKKIRG